MGDWAQFNSSCKTESEFTAERITLHDSMDTIKILMHEIKKNVSFLSTSEINCIVVKSFFTNLCPRRLMLFLQSFFSRVSLLG